MTMAEVVAFHPHVTDVVRIVYSTNSVDSLVSVVAVVEGVAVVAAAAAAEVALVVSDAVDSVVGWTVAPTTTTVAAAHSDVVVVSNIGAGSLIVVPSLLAQFSMPADVNVVPASLLQFAVVPVRSWRPD